MTVEEIAAKAWAPFVTLFVGVLGGGGLWKWLSAKATAQPDVIEASGQIINSAFAEMRSEIARQEAREKQLIADIRSAREARHQLANRLTALEGYTFRLLEYARSLLADINGAGREPPTPHGITIDELMKGPVAVYQPGASTMPHPVTEKDEDR
jgi:signal transduction histidine kinase